MIRASRTALQEQPNGDLICTITIKAADRAAVFAADELAICMAKMPGQLDAIPAAIDTPTPAEPAEAPDFQVQLEEAETADAKPPTQAIGVDGFETAKVVEAVTSGGMKWDHPAAPHIKQIYRHEPFQRWAMFRLNADAFAGPMECATRLIVKATKDRPMDVALSSLGRKMDQYMEWATAQNLPVWPEK